MEKLKTFIKNYWSYYLRLEARFLETLNYVEFDESNFKTYSFEYLHLLLSVCSEIDVVGKMMALEKNPELKENSNICEWWKEIQDNFPVDGKRLNKQEATFLDKAKLNPWKGFEVDEKPCSGKKTPDWWRAHNDVKHKRTKMIDTAGKANYTEANLTNVANAFAGLYVLEHSFMKSIGSEDELKLVKISDLFEKEEKTICGVTRGTIKMDNKEMM